MSVGLVFGVVAYYDAPVESPPILLTSGDGEGTGGTGTGGTGTGGADTGGTRVSDGISDIVNGVIDSMRPGSGATGNTGTNKPRVIINGVIDSMRPGSGATGNTGTNKPRVPLFGNGRGGEVENPSGTETAEKAGTAVVTDSPMPPSASAHHSRVITQNAGRPNSAPTSDVAAQPRPAADTSNAADTTETRVGESAQPGTTTTLTSTITSASAVSAADTQPVIAQGAPAALAASPTPPANIVTGLLATFGLSPLATNNPLAPVDSPAMWGLLAWARRQYAQTAVNQAPTTVANPTQNSVVAGLTAPVLDPPLGQQHPPDQRLNAGDPLYGLGGVNQTVGNLVRPGLPGFVDLAALGAAFVRDEFAIFSGSPPPACSANSTCAKRLMVVQALQTPALPVIDTIDRAFIVLDWYGDTFGETAIRSLIQDLSGVSLGNGPFADVIDVIDLVLVDLDYFTGVTFGETAIRSLIFDPVAVLHRAVDASPVFLNLVGHQ